MTAATPEPTVDELHAAMWSTGLAAARAEAELLRVEDTLADARREVQSTGQAWNDAIAAYLTATSPDPQTRPQEGPPMINTVLPVTAAAPTPEPNLNELAEAAWAACIASARARAAVDTAFGDCEAAEQAARDANTAYNQACDDFRSAQTAEAKATDAYLAALAAHTAPQAPDPATVPPLVDGFGRRILDELAASLEREQSDRDEATA